MKRHPSLRLAALAAAAILTCGGALANPVKIGLIETLSGPQAASGLMYRAAARYAIAAPCEKPRNASASYGFIASATRRT